MKLIYVVSVFIALGSLLSCESKKDEKKEKPPVKVDVLIAKKVDFINQLEVNGNVLSENMVELHFESSGRITYLNLPDGAFVKKGSLLAKINDSELQAQLKQFEIQLSLAKKTEERLKKLLAINGVNQSDYDAALSQKNTIEANIEIVNAQLEKTQIIAPFSGTLGLRMVSMGAFVNPQTVIGNLLQTDKIKVDFSVPEVYLSKLKMGDTIFVKGSNSDKKFPALVSAIESQTNPDSRNTKARAYILNSDLGIGGFVKVYIYKKQNTIVLPSNAIIPDFNSNQVIVFKNGKGVFTNVETGERDANTIQILKGIDVGDTIVVSGVLFVRPKAKLLIKKYINIDSLYSIKSN